MSEAVLKAHYVQPVEKSAQEAVEAIKGELALFDDWMERYQYLIELGKKLPPPSPALLEEANKIAGCQSQVWMQSLAEGGALYFAGQSDAAIVRGLLALLLRVYSGRSPQEIKALSPEFLRDMGLLQALSPNRGNGMWAMAEFIHATAQKATG